MWTKAAEGLMLGMRWAFVAHQLSHSPQLVKLQPAPLLGSAPLEEGHLLTRVTRSPSSHPP